LCFPYTERPDQVALDGQLEERYQKAMREVEI
jgi:hypothetical protein